MHRGYNQRMSISASKGDLTTGSLRSHLVRLTIPMIWGICAIISFQLVNTFYISMLGTEKLAAISFTFPITYSIFAIFLGFGIAMSSVVSRLIGHGQADDVRRVTTHGLLLSFGASLLVTVCGIAFLDPLFSAMGADAEMIELIDDYMHLYYLGIPFICLPVVGNAAMRAGGDTATQAKIMVTAALANALIDPILIFGLFGAPRLELQGAAISTVIANACAMLAGLYVLKKRGMIAPSYLHDLSRFGDSARRLLIIAVPAGITTALPAILNSVIINLLSHTGAAPVAAFGVVTRIEAFVFIIMMALSVGMGPIIGQNWGAGRFDRVRDTLKQALAFCVIWSALVALVLYIFRAPLSSAFSDDADVAHYIALYLLIVPFSYPLANLVSGWGSAFNAMGKPQFSSGMLFLKMIVILIPGVYMGYNLAGAAGIFAAIAIVNLITGTAFHLWSWRYCSKAAGRLTVAAQTS